jgi:hypothetical protein
VQNGEGMGGIAYAHHAVRLGAHGIEGGGVGFWSVHVGRPGRGEEQGG